MNKIEILRKSKFKLANSSLNSNSL